jgi:hypothetical protein
VAQGAAEVHRCTHESPPRSVRPGRLVPDASATAKECEHARAKAVVPPTTPAALYLIDVHVMPRPIHRAQVTIASHAGSSPEPGPVRVSENAEKRLVLLRIIFQVQQAIHRGAARAHRASDIRL